MLSKGYECRIRIFVSIATVILLNLCLFSVKCADASSQKEQWYKTCRPHLEWVNWDPNLDVEKYTDELIARAKILNSDTLIYPWESGGYLL